MKRTLEEAAEAAGALIKKKKEDDKEIQYDFPEVVVVLLRIFEVAKDTPFVRTCRFVCKSWNTVACRYLREHTVVELMENTGRAWEFKMMLQDRQRFIDHNNSEDFPSPFGGIHIKIGTFGDHALRHIMQTDKVKVTHVEVESILPQHMPEFNGFLRKREDTITQLQLTFGEEKVAEPNPPVKLTALQTLVVEDDCLRKCPHVPYIRSILENSTPTSLVLEIQARGGLARILGKGYTCSSKLTSLMIYVPQEDSSIRGSVISMDDANAIGTIQPPGTLNSLVLSFGKITAETSKPLIQLVKQLRFQLKKLAINSLALDDIDFELPKLKHLEMVQNGGLFVGFPPSKFPALTFLEMHLTLEEMPAPDLKPSEAHAGVTCLRLKLDGDFTDTEIERTDQLLSWLGKLTPNLTKISLDTLVSHSLAMHWQFFEVLHRHFPNIKVLRAGAWANESCFTGYEFADSSDNVPRKICLSDFQELERIHFEAGICEEKGDDLAGADNMIRITKNLVTMGLARLPNLKTVIMEGHTDDYKIEDEHVFQECLPLVEVIKVRHIDSYEL